MDIKDNSFDEGIITDGTARSARLIKYLNEISAKMILPPDEDIERIRVYLNDALSKGIPLFSRSPAVFYALSNTLCNKGNLSMGEVSRILSIPLSTTTRLVD